MNKKILMSMVAASISAMSIAPDLMKEAQAATLNTTNLDNNESNTSKNIIKLSNIKALEEGLDIQIKTELQEQVSAMLAKKTPIAQLSESISVLIDNYGDENGTIQETIFKELNFGAQADSAHPRPNLSDLSQPGMGVTQNFTVCHSACHGACHSACHGSRGWR